jgi:hypothetical protein
MENNKSNLSYEESDRSLYEELKVKPSSPFYNKNFAEIFYFSVCYAYSKKLVLKKIKKKAPNIPISALGEKFNFLRALVIGLKKDYEILYEEKKTHEILEKYAREGVRAIHREVFKENGDFLKKLLKEVNKSL